MVTSSHPDVVVIGAGVVGAACALYATRAGLRVTVVDRGSVAGGTTGAGEGNILVSDKPPGAELDLALLSVRLWRGLAESVGGFEYDPKGGLVVSGTTATLNTLADTAGGQREHGVEARDVVPEQLHEYEPHLTHGLAGGAFYPQDAQVQPALAAARMLRDARRDGALVRAGVEVTGILRSGDRIAGVRTSAGDLPAGAVVNAAGTWGGEVAELAGVHVPVLPRRGFVLVTEALPPRVVRHKVYAAEYVSDVASDDATLQSSPVIEGTAAGPVLIGSSRERLGFDRTLSVTALRRIAAHAVRLFPMLAEVAVIRTYRGFRPYCPDHLPVIGADARSPGLFHACGHEGAGVGLAAASGHLVAQALSGQSPDLDLTPFRPERFA